MITLRPTRQLYEGLQMGSKPGRLDGAASQSVNDPPEATSR
jgi:hypothetical protein